MAHQFNPTILREYDIRGIVGDTLTEADAYALGQYDATMMVLDAVAHGASDAAAVTHALATEAYQGLAMTYRSNGRGDMAHSAIIVCFDGKSRIPAVAKHYDFPPNT